MPYVVWGKMAGMVVIYDTGQAQQCFAMKERFEVYRCADFTFTVKHSFHRESNNRN
jgi:hypothetical protein